MPAAEMSILALEKLFSKMIENQTKTLPVKIVDNYCLWTFSELAKAATTNTEYQDKDKPQIKFRNPKNNADVFISQLSLIPDDNFKTLGLCKIIVNDSFTIFENRTLADFENVNELNLDLQKPVLLKKHNDVKIFIKSSEGTEVKITALVKLIDK